MVKDTVSVITTVNQEVFGHENIYVLNFLVNISSWVPRKNILT